MEPHTLEADALASATPPGGAGRSRHRSRALEVVLLILWLVALFIGTALLTWRLGIAKHPAPTLTLPSNPLHLVGALAVAAVGGAVIAGILTLYPNAGLILLAVTAPLEEVLYISVGGFRVKPYEAIVLGLVVALFARHQLRMDRLTGVLTAYVLVGVVSIGFDPSAPLFNSLQVIVFELLMVVLFMVTRATVQMDLWGEEPAWITRSRTELEWALAPVMGRLFMRLARTEPTAEAGAAGEATDRFVARARRLTVFYVLVVGNGVSLYGLGQFVGYYLGLPIPYFHPEAYAIFRPYATFIEPNPFGTFLTAQIALALTLLLAPAFRRWRRALVATLALQFAVLAVNLSRGSWLAAALIIVLLAIIGFRRAPDLPRIGIIVVGVAIVAVAAGGLLVWLNPAIAQTIAGRLTSFTNLNGGTLHWRTSDFLLALQAWALRPVIGYGPGTWGTIAYGVVGKTAVTSPRNIFTAWLYERGLVGALLAVGFYKLYIERAINAYRAEPKGQRQTLMLAYGMATLAVFVGFLSASAEIVPYYWFQLGVLAALSDVVLPKTTTENSHAPQTPALRVHRGDADASLRHPALSSPTQPAAAGAPDAREDE